MKKIYILLFTIFACSILVNAQGIYQMWGMTQSGGTSNAGTIFSTNSLGNNFQNRYSFKNEAEGASSSFSEMVEYNGKFYGMTKKGGANDLGVIYEWNPLTNIYIKKNRLDNFGRVFSFWQFNFL